MPMRRWFTIVLACGLAAALLPAAAPAAKKKKADAVAIERAKAAGWKKPAVLARHGTHVVLAGTREGRRELLLVTDADAPPATLAEIVPPAAKVKVTVGPFDPARGVLLVEARATSRDGATTRTSTSRVLVRAAGAPEVACELPEAEEARHEQCGRVSWFDVVIHPVAGQPDTFDVTTEGHNSTVRVAGGECDLGKPSREPLRAFRYTVAATGSCARQPLARHGYGEPAVQEVPDSRRTPGAPDEDSALERAAAGGWEQAAILARHQDVVVLSGIRDGRRELIVMGADAAAAPVVLGDAVPSMVRHEATIEPFPHVKGTLLVVARASWDDADTTRTSILHYLVRDAGRPELACRLPDGFAAQPRTGRCGRTAKISVTIDPVPDKSRTFDVTVQGYSSAGRMVDGHCQHQLPSEVWPETDQYTVPASGMCTKKRLPKPRHDYGD